MKENTKKGVSRREFLGLSALGLASLTILPSWAMNGVRIAPSDRVVLGFIGLGQQALSDFKGFGDGWLQFQKTGQIRKEPPLKMLFYDKHRPLRLIPSA